MNDYIIRATAANETVRAFAIRSTELTAEAREIHRTLPVVTAALGRLLSAGAMMGSMMKGDKDKLTLMMKGDGPIGQMTVTVDSHGNVKGFPANPAVAERIEHPPDPLMSLVAVHKRPLTSISCSPW